MIDLHTHILPGLDDGAETLEESIEMVRQLSYAGFTTVVATPHVIEGKDTLSPQVILDTTTRLQEAVQRQGLKINILPGAENYIFPQMAQWLEQGRLMTLGNTGKYLLFELPMLDIPHYTDEVLFELQVAGVTPIIAHPERNKALQEEPERIVEWAKKGVLFQLNLRSLRGRHGPEAQRFGNRLVESGLIHCLGSDIHHVPSGENTFISELTLLKERIDSKAFEEITDFNPSQIVAGNSLTAAETYEFKNETNVSWRQRIRELFSKLLYKELLK